MILITRPENDSLALGHKLDLLSINYKIFPIIEITYTPNLENELESKLRYIENGIITSKNALKAVSKIVNKNIRLNIVGASTANFARSIGFNNIGIVENDVNSLIKQLKINYQKKSKFIYFRGNIITSDLKNILSEDFILEELICYNSRRKASIDNQLPGLIKNNSFKAILFYSEMTALYFLEIIYKKHLINELSNVIAVSISEKVSSVLSTAPWNNILTADEPCEDAILKIVKEIYFGRN